MGSRSFRGLGAGRWVLGRTQTIRFSAIVSAVFALSAVASSYVVVAQTLPERARTEALARRATERLQALQREADRLAVRGAHGASAICASSRSNGS